VGGVVLNIVTINIHQSSKALHTVGLAMSKHNWHIALIQETGIVKKPHTNVHECWRQTLQHLILFNPPNNGYLAAKQKNRKMELYRRHVSNGSMTEDQLKEKLDLMTQYTAMPEGGMAIMINKTIAQYIQNHKITKISNGVPQKNKRLMGVSLSINHRYVLLLNTYAPAKGRKKNDEWMAKQLIPIMETCQEANWLSIIGGDLNAMAYKSDICPTPPLFKPSWLLLALTSPAHGLIDSF
jgi:hypothetical protein